MAKNVKDPVVQKAEFSRIGHKDMVTGNVTYEAWEPPKATLAEVSVPEVTGYTPNMTSVPAVDVTGESQNTEVSVIYSPKGSTIIINFIDTDLSDHIVKTKTLTGKYGDSSSYTTADDITTLLGQGYQVKSDNVPTNLKFGDKPITYTVELKHAIIDVTPSDPEGVTDLTRTVTRTISFSYSED